MPVPVLIRWNYRSDSEKARASWTTGNYENGKIKRKLFNIDFIITNRLLL